MCGITGFVGRPKSGKTTKLSYQLSTKLLALTVTRGNHATGAFNIFPPKEGSDKETVFVYKLDAPSTQFVTTDRWKATGKKNPNLFLGHCRFGTHGSAKVHINNHPHVSDDRTLAIVHNGVIRNFDTLKKSFPVQGECDSEIILRIIEKTMEETMEDNSELSPEEAVVEGIKEVLALTQGSVACLASYYNKETQEATFFAFRNRQYPLVMVDLRDKLGQVFFASTNEIAKEGLQKSGMPKKIQEAKIVDVPPFEICVINREKMEITYVKAPETVVACTSYRDPVGVGGGAGAGGAYSGQSWGNNNSGRHQQKVFQPKWRTDAISKIDCLIEGLTEIDDRLGKSTASDVFGLTPKEVNEFLDMAIWNVESITNPDVNGTDENDENDENDDDQVDFELGLQTIGQEDLVTPTTLVSISGPGGSELEESVQ